MLNLVGTNEYTLLLDEAVIHLVKMLKLCQDNTFYKQYESLYDKTKTLTCQPTLSNMFSQGRPSQSVSQSPVFAVQKDLCLHHADSDDPDQTLNVPRWIKSSQGTIVMYLSHLRHYVLATWQLGKCDIHVLSSTNIFIYLFISFICLYIHMEKR